MKRLGEVTLFEGTKKELQFSGIHGDEFWVKTDNTGKHFSMKNNRGVIEDLEVSKPSYTITVTIVPGSDEAYIYMYSENVNIEDTDKITKPKAIYLDGEAIDLDKLVYVKNSGTNAYYYTGKTLYKDTLHTIQYEFESGDITIYDPAFSGYYLKSYAFDASFIMSNNFTSISPSMFAESHYKAVVLSDGITIIPKRAFVSCNLTSIKLPSNLLRIEDEAFKDALSTSYIVIPKTVTYIGNAAFNQLVTIYYEGTEAEWNTLISNSSSNWCSGEDMTVICSDTPDEETEDA